MPNQAAIVQTALEQTVSAPPSNEGSGIAILRYMAQAGLSLYPWWSKNRDIQLRKVWKQSDHLSGAIYTMQSKLSAIPVAVVARNMSIKEHVAEARDATFALLAGAEFGAGWPTFVQKYVEDLTSQDNGVFAEVIGGGAPDGPIVGRPVTVRHLDASQCTRTGNPIYPVVYTDQDGKRYKLHHTRVMMDSQMPSPIAAMYGVGFCAISRAINIAQSLLDMIVYKQEKLGGRPHRGMLITRGGLDPDQVREAFDVINAGMDSRGLTRYSQIALVGSAALPEADLHMVDLASLPDGFDERTSTELGMAVIAVAFGMDLRDLFPIAMGGSTRAEALIQHLKQRGKGPGQIIQSLELAFNYKYLPPYLELKFDFQDDEQDRQTADTKEIRARRWHTSLQDAAIDLRTSREQMLEVGDLSQSQFDQLELQDGRLPDGTPVLALFRTEDKKLKKLLNLGILGVDPLDVEMNRAEIVLDAIHKKRMDVEAVLVNSNNPGDRWNAQQALAALNALEKKYLEPPKAPVQESEPEDEEESEEGEESGEEGIQQHDDRLRRVDPMNPKPSPLKPEEAQINDQDRGRKD